MIQRSTSLYRRLVREMTRAAGSQALLVFYSGEIPPDCEAPARGEKLRSTRVPDGFFSSVLNGTPPALPEGATWWRVLDNGGLVVMQGDGT